MDDLSDNECQLYDFTKSANKNKREDEDVKNKAYNSSWLGMKTINSCLDNFKSIKISAGKNIYDHLMQPPNPIGHYRSLMNSATSYEQWSTAAAILDQLEGKEDWKQDPTSILYDYELIHARLAQLRKARAEKDYSAIIYLLRTSLSRDFGDIGKAELYGYTHIGTKTLIEVYIAEVVKLLNMLADADSDVIDLRAKYDLILNTRQAFGRTALLLSGGSTFGLSHVGVCRSLAQAKLLPRIISGASSGSIVASLFCTKDDDEIEQMLCSGELNMNAFDNDKEQTILERTLRFLKSGVIFDVNTLIRCIKGLTGDYTFQEAYNKTRKILNIPVSSSTVYEMPRLLNYVTAPNVLIWSAVAASCSVPLVFESTSIYAKDRSGRIRPWNPTGSRWIDGSVENDLPMNKLSEMFNVNHFIVCQVNPHVVPFLEKSVSNSRTSKIIDWTMSFAKSELQHRLLQMSELGVMKSTAYMLQNILSQKYVGDITIVPEIPYVEFTKLFINPTPENISESISRGEKAIWPKMSIIKNHCLLELCIDEIIYRLRIQLFTQTHSNNNSSSPEDSDVTPRPIPRSASSSHFANDRKFNLTGLSAL